VRAVLQQAADPSRQFSREDDALVLDFYGMQRWQQPARDRKVEDESRNQPFPEDHHHGNAAHVHETGPSVRSGVRQAGQAVRTRKLSAADRGAARACRSPNPVTVT